MFEYVIEYYDLDTGNEATDAGFVSASTWAEAARKISEYYGEGNTVSLNLSMTEDIYSFEENDVEWDFESFDD